MLQVPALILMIVLAIRLDASVKGTVLYQFPENGSTGNYPQGAMIADKAGNLYGTTILGGNYATGCSVSGCGVVFELFPPSQQGDPWTESVIYAFQGSNDGTLVRW